jgi:hypothetical protein
MTGWSCRPRVGAWSSYGRIVLIVLGVVGGALAFFGLRARPGRGRRRILADANILFWQGEYALDRRRAASSRSSGRGPERRTRTASRANAYWSGDFKTWIVEHRTALNGAKPGHSPTPSSGASRRRGDKQYAEATAPLPELVPSSTANPRPTSLSPPRAARSGRSQGRGDQAPTAPGRRIRRDDARELGADPDRRAHGRALTRFAGAPPGPPAVPRIPS